MPKPWDQTSAPSWTTATEIPGTLFVAMKLEAAFSTCARLSAERLLLWAPQDEGRKKKTNSKSVIEQLVLPIFGKQVMGIDFT